ncbi:MAG: hypothetical protein ABT05_03030 [Lautropia sp. SCN 66-9]|nr:MAG: hypothetical protein ABT05_03030 [Lautropia sp. SCN 66-9]
MKHSRKWEARANGGVCTLKLNGQFDFNCYPEFRSLTEQALAMDGIGEYLVDLRDVDYLDSSALGMLLNFNDAVVNQGRRLAVANAHGLAEQILRIANFQKVVEMR